VNAGPARAGEVDESWTSGVAPKGLKRKTASGALVSTGAQAATLALRTGSLMVLARLLLKEDFGLVGMATAFIGCLGLLKDAGLSMATIQSASLTLAQTSALFWINFAGGALLAVLAATSAPLLTAFYGEPRLFWITVALGTSLLFSGAAAQHRAMLQRSMRFATLAVIDAVSILVGIAVAVGMAVAGYGYWALVAMTITPTVVVLLGVFLATGWVPASPRRWSGIRPMLAFGGAVTVGNLMYYVAYNADKMLIGRVLGAEALGVYGRAYQLINLPTENLSYTLGLVAFPALARIQKDPARLRRSFLEAYRVFLSLVVPITMACTLFAADMILVFLGPRWQETVGIFRLLAPTILVFAVLNPLSHLMLAGGHVGRYLGIAGMITPVLLLSYALGLQHGLEGVAAGFSTAMILAALPVMLWAKHGTLITMRDILKAMTPPIASIIVGAAAALGAQSIVDRVEAPLARLVVECSILCVVYLITLLFAMGQLSVYTKLLRETGLLGRWQRPPTFGEVASRLEAPVGVNKDPFRDSPETENQRVSDHG
jgi:O-antigen/teichoic acid export membrane protein